MMTPSSKTMLSLPPQQLVRLALVPGKAGTQSSSSQKKELMNKGSGKHSSNMLPQTLKPYVAVDLKL